MIESEGNESWNFEFRWKLKECSSIPFKLGALRCSKRENNRVWKLVGSVYFWGRGEPSLLKLPLHTKYMVEATGETSEGFCITNQDPSRPINFVPQRFKKKAQVKFGQKRQNFAGAKKYWRELLTLLHL